jgi:hypothetical protein
MTTDRIVLSTVEYEVVWSQLELGRMPYPLTVPSVGFLAEERRTIVARAWESLAERGLADGTRVDDDLADLLRLLARPSVSVDALGDIGEPLRALAVRDGDAAAAAMLTDAGLTVTAIHPAALARNVTGLLPYAEPGPGHAFTFPHRVLSAALAEDDDDGGDVFFDGDEHSGLVRAGMTTGDARLLAELADARRYGGQFGINSRHRSRGGMVRQPTLVTWFDTQAGRYLVVREQDWVSVTPTGTDRIAKRLDQLLASAADDR